MKKILPILISFFSLFLFLLVGFSYAQTAPPAPTNLNASPQGETQINLSWENNTANATYEVDRRLGTEQDNSFTQVANPNTTTHQDTGLTQDTEYCYRVRTSVSGVDSPDSPTVCARTAAPSANPGGGNQLPSEGEWVPDSEVTFVGKMGARSGLFLDWALENYNWTEIREGESNPLTSFWATIRNIVYAFFALFVLATAFIFIVTRGENLTVRKLIPRFVIIVLLVTFSFAIIQLLYQVTDIVQGFFLVNPDENITYTQGPNQGSKIPFISQRNLLNISFNYQDFEGFRRLGSEFDESAFISLLLVKLTAITYYVMTGILILRKIILWFFIIISPVFPLLLFYSPIRNTAKIWVGEFFRWLLYAPLFAIFLSGVVAIWRSQTNIPLGFDFTGAQRGEVVFPTAVNILVGGPQQQLSLTNSLNLTDTFALYVVALLMLWVVILLPFILLQIFLDYLKSLSFSENNIVKSLVGSPSALLKRGVPPPEIPPPPAPSLAPAGLSRSLPFANKFAIPFTAQNQASNLRSTQITSEVIKAINISIPKLRDIARLESSSLGQEKEKLLGTLEKISKPSQVSTFTERQKFQEVRTKLLQAMQKGDPLATSILAAADKEKKDEKLDKDKLPFKGTKAPGEKEIQEFPQTNRVQSVSLEEYEEVRQMWEENYQKLEPPREIDGTQKSRKEWIENDIGKITETINLLLNPMTVQKGMEMVSNILPFLLIGGFSKEEVIAYLKAKLEAGKSVVEKLKGTEEEEATTLEVKRFKEEKPKEMHMEEKVQKDTPELDKGGQK